MRIPATATSSCSAIPVDISQTFVKRVVGVPGDHIKIIDQQVYRNGQKLDEPYVVHKSAYPDSFRDNFPNSEPNFMSARSRPRYAGQQRRER